MFNEQFYYLLHISIGMCKRRRKERRFLKGAIKHFLFHFILYFLFKSLLDTKTFFFFSSLRLAEVKRRQTTNARSRVSSFEAVAAHAIKNQFPKQRSNYSKSKCTKLGSNNEWTSNHLHHSLEEYVLVCGGSSAPAKLVKDETRVNQVGDL